MNILNRALSSLLAVAVSCWIIVFFGFSANVQADDSIEVTTGEWPPYTSESFLHGGVLTRICTEAFALEGVDVRYSYFPWIRSMDELRSEHFAASLGWRKTPEREARFFFSDPLFEESEVFFYPKDKEFDWETLDDVANLRIGTTLGYASGEVLEPVVERGRGRLDMAPDEAMSFQKLVRGRVDVVPATASVGYYILQSKFLPGTAELITHHPRPILTGGLHLIVARDYPGGQELIERFNRGLARLRESGEYDRFMNESLRGEYSPK